MTTFAPVAAQTPIFWRGTDSPTYFAARADELNWAAARRDERVSHWWDVAYGPWTAHSATVPPVAGCVLVEVQLAGDEPSATHIGTADSFGWSGVAAFRTLTPGTPRRWPLAYRRHAAHVRRALALKAAVAEVRRRLQMSA